MVRANAFNFARARPGDVGTRRGPENVSVARAAVPTFEHEAHTCGSARWPSMFHDLNKNGSYHDEHRSRSGGGLGATGS